MSEQCKHYVVGFCHMCECEIKARERECARGARDRARVYELLASWFAASGDELNWPGIAGAAERFIAERDKFAKGEK